MALVTLRHGAGGEAPLNVVSAESDGGTSATFVGGDVQPFTGIVIDTTFADTQWHTQQCVTEVALPVNVPRGGGPVKFSVDFPVDQLVNMKSVRVTMAYRVRSIEAGAPCNVVIADNIVLCNDKYPIKKTTVIINNQPQFGTMQNRDHAIIARRLHLLQGLHSHWDNSIKRTHAAKNGFLPNHQTLAENRAGKSGIYADVAAAGPRVAFAQCPTSRDGWAAEVKHLVKVDTEELLEGRENFCRVETESEGIMGASCMYPGIMTNFQMILELKAMYEFLYCDLTNGAVPAQAITDTHKIEHAYFQITRIFVEYQTLLPSTALWDALSNAATAGGGVAKSPSYPIDKAKLWWSKRIRKELQLYTKRLQGMIFQVFYRSRCNHSVTRIQKAEIRLISIGHLLQSNHLQLQRKAEKHLSIVVTRYLVQLLRQFAVLRVLYTLILQ